MESVKQAAKRLSPTEHAIAQRFVGGYEVKEIASERCISPATVSWHLAKVRRKLSVTCRSELRAILEKPHLAANEQEPGNGTANRG